MKGSLVLLVVVSLTMVLVVCPASAESGGVVRIHFSDSVDPDLSEIIDTYHGSGIIRAHLVIDSMPGGRVSAFHVGFDIESEDTSVMVLGGFHPHPGWELIDPATEFPSLEANQGAPTPVSVGYWNLWLKNGEASKGYIRLRSNSYPEGKKVNLADGASNWFDAVRAYHGALNMGAPVPTDLSEIGQLTYTDWMSLPELTPEWVLHAEGDSVRILKNDFALGDPFRPFPVHIVRVSREHKFPLQIGEGERTIRASVLKTIYVSVRPNGTVEDLHIPSNGETYPQDVDRRVACSLGGKVALVSDGDHTELRDSTESVISVIPGEVGRVWTFDIPRRILAVLRVPAEEAGVGAETKRIMVLDYNGDIVYETDLSGCDIANATMGRDPSVIWLSLGSCSEEGNYILRIDEGETYSVGSLPRSGRRFSPDARYVLLNEGGFVQLFRARGSSPQSLEHLWQVYIAKGMTEIAVAEGGKYVAFRTDWDTGPIRHIYVLSGESGTPVCRLSWREDNPAPGPLAFTGDYLFAGMGFGQIGTAWNTEFVYLYDLSSIGQVE